MSLEGKLLSNRYQLIEKIGGGGMAEVYKARCTLLDRFVAIKILKTEMVNDPDIVQSFKIEAQAAGRLSHPNVVSIYDVGQEGDIFYIVMEYVDGATIKELVASKGALPWQEALNYGIQVASALEAAHAQNIVHRDIKPQNIIISKDGIAKVTDFGIARALNKDKEGNSFEGTIGSVHYISPEQAKGEDVSAKTDIYSFGVCMYEMVTGMLPFNARTPISVAMKHITEIPLHPCEIKPLLPKSIGDLIIKCMQKEPIDRYSSATKIIMDINKILINPEIPIFEQETELGKTRKYNPLTDEEIKSGLKKSRANNKAKKKMSTGMIFGVVIASGILLMLLLFTLTQWMFGGGKDGKTGEKYTVENFVNMTLDEAEELLAAEADWILIETVEQSDENIEEGYIISQDILQNTILYESQKPTITFTVSSGKTTITLPDYRDKAVADYKAELTELGFVISETKEFNDLVKKGEITKVEPIVGSELEPEAEVKIFISKGKPIEKITVPSFIGLTYKKAKKSIESAGLTLAEVTPDEAGNDNYIVEKQTLDANTTVKKGTAISLTLNKYKYEDRSIDLNKYGVEFPVNLHIEAIPSDTNIAEDLVRGTFIDTKFPMTISNIKVPIGGYTTLNIFVDDVLLQSYDVK